MPENKNHYQVLQVDPSAGQDIITAAYKQLAKTFHPDVNKSPEANRAMQRINIAYQVLSNPVERARYDRELQEQRENQDTPGKKDAGPTQEPSNPQYQQSYSDIRYPDTRYPFQGANPATPVGQDHSPEWLRRERDKARHRWTKDVRHASKQKRAKTKGSLRWGWTIIYILLASVLFVIFGSQVNSIEGVIVILAVTLIFAIPILFRLDDYLRK